MARTRSRRHLGTGPRTDVCAPALALALVVTSCTSQEVYSGWTFSPVEFDQADTRSSGPILGWQGSNGNAMAGFIELGLREDESEGFRLTTLGMGLRTRAAVSGPLELRGQADIGLAGADLDRLRNSNSLGSIGFGVQPALRLHKHLSIVAMIGYRFYWDTTEPTTCNDGTTSSSVGSGTCSHHGGIRHYNEELGNGQGPEMSIGLRISF